MINKSKRDLRQEEVVNKWINNCNYNGYFLGCTGVGKSRVGTMCIDKLDTPQTIHIVSPTIKIKEQWEVLVSKYKQHKIECFVINTYAKTIHNCDFLIIDEFHSVLNEDTTLFKYALINSNRKKFLGLSATVKPEEEAYVQSFGISKIDEISLHEALAEGYIAPYIEYNLGITMSEIDNIIYRKINKDYSYHFEIFNRDFNLAMACLKPLQAEEYGNRVGLSKNQVQLHAVRFTRLMRERKDFLHRTPSKLELTKQIINKFNTSKIITFGQVTDTADKLTNDLPEISISYHSNIEPITVNGKVLKGKKCLDYKINQFVDNRYKIRVVNTVKALTEGADFPDISVGIAYARTTNDRIYKQSVGRCVRLYKDKVSIFINIYIKNTQDAVWLKKAQKDSKNIRWIDSIDEINFDLNNNISLI